VIEMAEGTTAEEREAVFRFWYSVYVVEMGRYRNVADHDKRQWRDPEDDRNRILYAADDGVVVGANRISWGGDGFSERLTQNLTDPDPARAVEPILWR
jgi:hypothetical protein